MIIGIGLAIFAGFLGGIALLPLRYTTKWSFESTWFFWCLFAYIILPLIVVVGFVPNFMAVYREVGIRLFGLAVVAGFFAGAGGFLMGFSTSKIGVASSNAIANGLSLALGSIIPLMFQHKEILKSSMLYWLILGLILSLIGVSIFAYASHIKGKAEELSNVGSLSKTSRNTIIGLIAAFVAGLFFPVINLGIAFADDFMKVAVKYGSDESIMTFVFYLPLFLGAFISNSAYSITMWKRQRTSKEIGNSQTKRIILIAFGMAVVWTVSNLAYGWSMPFMKGYGPVVGWPLFMALCNIGAVALEYFIGDWKGKALKIMLLGMFVLTLSIFIFTMCSMQFQ